MSMFLTVKSRWNVTCDSVQFYIEVCSTIAE